MYWWKENKTNMVVEGKQNKCGGGGGGGQGGKNRNVG